MNQNFKKFCFFVLFAFSLSFSPCFSAESAGNIFSGQYRLSLESHSQTNLIFYLRSSGSSGIVRGNGDFQYADVDFYLMQGLASHGPDPLPVGHILITYGSDEETSRLILRLVNTGDEKEKKIQVMDAVITFVDGPNGLQNWSQQKVLLERYDPATKKWIPLK